jgi:hypothetical protein
MTQIREERRMQHQVHEQTSGQMVAQIEERMQ